MAQLHKDSCQSCSTQLHLPHMHVLEPQQALELQMYLATRRHYRQHRVLCQKLLPASAVTLGELLQALPQPGRTGQNPAGTPLSRKDSALIYSQAQKGKSASQLDRMFLLSAGTLWLHTLRPVRT